MTNISELWRVALAMADPDALEKVEQIPFFCVAAGRTSVLPPAAVGAYSGVVLVLKMHYSKIRTPSSQCSSPIMV
jgi:hypothetical protein